MDSETLVRETLRKMLADIEPRTGKTKWQSLKEVMQRQADKGDARYLKLLKKSAVIGAENSSFIRDATG